MGVAVLVAVGLVVGVGVLIAADEDEQAVTGGPGGERIAASWGGSDERSEASSPFAVGWVPDGFEPVVAGAGEGRLDWGEDCCGTHEPMTVLAPTGEDLTADNAVVVSVTGFGGYQGGLAQAAKGYLGDIEWFRAGGKDAIFTAGDASTGAEVVVAVEEDLAVRVDAMGLGRDELAALVAGVRPQGQVEPPEVAAPDGYRVVGSADARFASALGAGVDERADGGPGPAGAHGAGWRAGETGLVVMALPGVSADPAVLFAERSGYELVHATSELDVGGRRAVHQTAAQCDGACHRTTSRLVATTPWGDTLVVEAAGAQVPPSEDLARIAASVEAVDRSTWDAFVVEVSGGPGLHPDEGMTEVARGTHGGVEWLLQALPNTPGADAWSVQTDVVPGGQHVTDSCLKLSTRKRVCAGSGSMSEALIVRWTHASPGAEAGAPDLPGFVIVDTTSEAAALRVRAGGRESTGQLSRLPGDVGRWAGVAFVDHPGIPTCQPPDPALGPPPDGLDLMRLDLLAADGTELRCIGVGEGG